MVCIISRTEAMAFVISPATWQNFCWLASMTSSDIAVVEFCQYCFFLVSSGQGLTVVVVYVYAIPCKTDEAAARRR